MDAITAISIRLAAVLSYGVFLSISFFFFFLLYGPLLIEFLPVNIEDTLESAVLSPWR